MQSVSVIVATKDRPSQLEELFRSMLKAGDSYYELLVVDSTVTKKVSDINSINTAQIGGKYTWLPEKGVSKARNVGIKESKGDIIVFADDDFIVKKGWIDNLIPNFCDKRISCVTGRMISYRHDDASCLYEKAMSYDRGLKKRVFSRSDLKVRNLFLSITKIGQRRLADRTPVPWAVGYGFCAFRREVFQDVGLFDENIGRGTKGVGGEDIDMFYRIMRMGQRIIYEPKAVILHQHRKELEQVFEDARKSGISMRVLIGKYSKKDFYLRCVFFGYLFLAFFSTINATLRYDKDLRRMIKTELCGFLQPRL